MVPDTKTLSESTALSRNVPFQRSLRGHPLLGMFLCVLLSNAAGSLFNILYNRYVIVERTLDAAQQQAFYHIALPVYNLVAYPLAFALMVWLIWPLAGCWRQLQKQEAVDARTLEFCRRRVVNTPFLQLFINFFGWIPGAVVFPWIVCTWGSLQAAGTVWLQFGISFAVSAVFTTVQTFFLLEWYLMAALYPVFFVNERPANVQGVVRIPFVARLLLLWLAVAVMPLVAVVVVALNIEPDASDADRLQIIAGIVAFTGTLFGFLIFAVVGFDLRRWLRLHETATGQIAQGRFAARVEEKRPDEWGRLSDRFNDMAVALERGQMLRETFGQFVSPEVRDEILERMPGLEVKVQEITVLFADIRGFTKRCAGEAPERVGALLNQFLTLALGAIEEKGGYVNRFLGDGVLAMFNAPLPRPDHAGLAVACALEMLARLEKLNRDLAADGIAPLTVGVGIHTGAALVGCFGAAIVRSDGQSGMRREYTAIGETVNYGQRLEQLTKQLGGPILLSAAARQKVRQSIPVEDLGAHVLPNSNETMVVYRVKVDIE
ncbi:MAG: HAMP domain-containing protein [Gemmataceae bacterium]|nr:HAMP domain-containing protein [Gemmataceae bacterium]